MILRKKLLKWHKQTHALSLKCLTSYTIAVVVKQLKTHALQQELLIVSYSALQSYHGSTWYSPICGSEINYCYHSHSFSNYCRLCGVLGFIWMLASRVQALAYTLRSAHLTLETLFALMLPSLCIFISSNRSIHRLRTPSSTISPYVNASPLASGSGLHYTHATGADSMFTARM